MSGLALLIPIAILMGLGSLVVFLWALRSGQYEDLDGAGERIFEEDLEPLPTPSEKPKFSSRR